MSHFSSILKYRKGKPPADAQEKAHADFPAKVTTSRLKLRSPQESLPSTGKHFIIGVATYSAPELELLDRLENCLEGAPSQNVDVAVFDVRDCKKMSDFTAFIPGIDSVYRTPIMGVISEGRLIDQASGMSDVVSTLQRFHVLNLP